MLLKKEVPIEDDDTAETLSKKLSAVGAELLVETIKHLKEGTLRRTPQDASLATMAPMLTKEMGKIDWSMKAQEINNLIRGLIPWPTAYTSMGGKMVKIYRARVTSGKGKPGAVIKAGEGRLIVATGEGALEILELQLEGGKRLTTAEFLRGHRIEEGIVLGD
jgi:methionyl-tRNA formyltransferase